MKIEDVKVFQLDKDKLTEKIKINSLKEQDELRIESIAIFSHHFDIDTDCCFSRLNNQLIDSEIKTVINIPCRVVTKNENGGMSFSAMPNFYITLTIAEFKEVANEVFLTDFIRFNYNPRIKKNQEMLLEYIKNV